MEIVFSTSGNLCSVDNTIALYYRSSREGLADDIFTMAHGGSLSVLRVLRQVPRATTYGQPQTLRASRRPHRI